MRPALLSSTWEEKYALVGVCELRLLRKDKTYLEMPRTLRLVSACRRDELRECAP